MDCCCVQPDTLQTALDLLDDSSTHITHTLDVLDGHGASYCGSIQRVVSAADSRAGEVCDLARRLLQLVRMPGAYAAMQTQLAGTLMLHRSNPQPCMCVIGLQQKPVPRTVLLAPACSQAGSARHTIDSVSSAEHVWGVCTRGVPQQHSAGLH